MGDKRRKRRGHSRYILFFFLILASLAIIGWAGYSGLCHAKWLTIRKVTVSGNDLLTTNTILGLVQEYQGRNLVEISSKELKQKLSRLRRLKEIHIVRSYPSTLAIKVTERRGLLYLMSVEGDLFPIDENGMVLEYTVYAAKEDLPIVHTAYHSAQLQVGRYITDRFTKNVMVLHKKILAVKPDFVKSISEYYNDGGNVCLIDAQYGTCVMLNDSDLKDQLRRYQFVQENGDINKSCLLDLRFKNQVIVRPEVR